MTDLLQLSFLLVLVISVLQQGDGQTSNSDTRLLKSTSTSKIVRFYGNSYILYSLDSLPAEYFGLAANESLSMKFLTQDSDGILWILKGSDRQIMHISTKDGALLFTIDDGRNPSQTIRVQSQNARHLNKAVWHSLKIEKDEKTLKFYVDNIYATQLTTSSNMQFLQRGTLYLGGIAKSVLNVVGDGFDGYLTNVEIARVMGPNKMVIFSFLQQVSSADTSGNIDVINPNEWESHNTNWSKPFVTRPPPELSTPISFASGSSVLILNEALDMRTGGSLSFEFLTLEPRGLLVLAQASAQSSNYFIAVEIFDGLLYFIYNLGTISGRKQFPDRVDDGEWHKIRLIVDGNQIILYLDGSPLNTVLTRDEMLTMYFNRLLLGGSDDFARAPWALYSRQGYKGCLKLLKTNNNGVDLTNSNIIRTTRGIERGCRSSTGFCQETPCYSGFCTDRMDGYVCDCSNTPFAGKNCSIAAIIAAWDGTLSASYQLPSRDVTHINDFSIRFMTPLANTLLFKTEADNKEDYIHGELDDGRAKVTVKVDGKTRAFVTGSNLNDYDWHTLYIRRRGDDVSIWVDDEARVAGVIGGKDYQLYIDRINLGSIVNTGTLRANNYIGYMQNFMINDSELLSLLNTQNTNINWLTKMPSEGLTQLIYRPITLTSSTAYFQLPALQIGTTTKMHFKFKTLEPNGLILYHSGVGNDAIAIELSNGKIRLAYNLGGQNAFTIAPTTKQLNDNQWHAVQVGLNERGQFTVKVDDANLEVSTSDGDGRLSLSGNLYIGGVPENMYSSPSLSGLIESRKGFRGCLASMDLNGAVPELSKYTEDTTKVLNGCNELVLTCKPFACGLGMCVPNVSGFYCDCNMTGYVGTMCTNYPEGYYFGKNGGKGIIMYEFPFEKQTSTSTDEIAFGFMTEQNNAVLYRIEGKTDSGEYIEIRLENGYIVADSSTGSGLISFSESAQKFNDGQYHTVRYIRTGRNSTLQVDKLPVQVIAHKSALSVFDNVYTILLGGKRDDRGNQIMNFNGIIGGAYYNGYRWLDMLLGQKPLYGKLVQMNGDIVLAKPFLLIKGGDATTHTPPDVIIPPESEVPVDIGGGGIIGSGIGGNGGGGQSEFLGIGGPGGLTGITAGIGLNVPEEPVPLAAASIGLTQPFLGTGARAGAVVGTVLGTLAFMTSLMWALYQLKPGIPTCLSPGASAAGGGAGMNISSPRATSNLGAVKAASAVGGASGAGVGAGGSKVIVVNGSASGADAGRGSSAYTSYLQSSTAATAGGIGGTSAAVGGTDIIDASTRQTTGTLSNQGTVIGTTYAPQVHIDSSGSGYSAHYQSNTINSYGSIAGGTMDRGSYDRQYMASTGNDGIPDYDLPVAGTMHPAHSYSSSTLNTHYNYQVQNFKTVMVNKQGQYVMANSMVGNVSPGAASDEVRVDCCLMTRDGNSVVTGSSLGPPQVWNMQNGELQNIMKGDSIGSTDLHLVCGDRLLVGAVHVDMEINEYSSRKGVFNHKLQIWDFMTGRPLSMAEGEYCSTVCPMSDPDKVLLGRTDKYGDATSIIAWDLMGNQMIKEMRYDIPVGNNDYISYLNISKNDCYIVAGFTNSFDNCAEFLTFDMTQTRSIINEPSLLKMDANVECTIILPKDEAVTGLRNGDLVVWNIQTGQPSRQLLSTGGAHAHTREVKSVTLSDDSRYLVSSSADRTLKVWDMHTERPIYTLQGHVDEVWCSTISSDNEIVVSGSADGTIRLWRMKNGTEMCVFNCGVNIFNVEMSRDKGTIVALGDKFGARKLIMLQVVRTKIKKIVSS